MARMKRFILLGLIAYIEASAFAYPQEGLFDGLFEGSADSPVVNGLSIQIAVTKKSVFFGEPFDVFVRLRNAEQSPIRLPIGSRSDDPTQGFLWSFSSAPPGDRRALSLASTQERPIVFLPPQSSVVFVLTDNLLLPGANSFSLTYHNDSMVFDDVTLWTGDIETAEIHMSVELHDKPSREEQSTIDKEIKRHIELFTSANEFDQYKSQHHLVYLALYSVPFLREALTDDRNTVRRNTVNTLARIADPSLADEKGFPRNTEAWPELTELLRREKDPRVRHDAIYALRFFDDVGAEGRNSMESVLLENLESPVPAIREAAAVVLLRWGGPATNTVLEKIGKDEQMDQMMKDSIFRVAAEEVLHKEDNEHIEKSTATIQREISDTWDSRVRLVNKWVLVLMVGVFVVGFLSALACHKIIARRRISR